MTERPADLLISAALVEIQATENKPPTVAIVAYTGGVMDVPGWGPLIIDLAGLELPASPIGLLADHDATLKGIVGHGMAQIRDGQLTVAGTITQANDAADKIVTLAKSGFPFQASVGRIRGLSVFGSRGADSRFVGFRESGWRKIPESL